MASPSGTPETIATPRQRTVAGTIILLGFFGLAAACLYVAFRMDWAQLPSQAAMAIGTIVGSVLTSAMNLAKDYASWLYGSSVGAETPPNAG